MGQRSIRFSDELEARIEAAARRDDRSFSYVVTRTMERALESALADAVWTDTAQTALREAVHGRAPVEKALEARDAVRARNASKQAPSLRDTWGR